nr:MAG TPA: hypothetical protein [Caudoviricetes sp.]
MAFFWAPENLIATIPASIPIMATTITSSIKVFKSIFINEC